jgi:hypothetical protein
MKASSTALGTTEAASNAVDHLNFRIVLGSGSGIWCPLWVGSEH